MISFALAAAIEVFASTGTANWTQLSPGGWNQPPLYSHFDGSTRSWSLGARYKDVELSYHSLGNVSVNGWFVPDYDYDAANRRVLPRTMRTDLYTASVSQSTRSVNLVYAPRWSRGRFSVSPEVGAAFIHQHEWGDAYKCDKLLWHMDQESNSRISPVLGIRVNVDVIGGLKVGVGEQWYTNAAYSDSLSHHLKTRFIEVRYSF